VRSLVETWEPPWLAAMRERWGVVRAEPLTLRAHLAGPVAVDAVDALTVEGALQSVALLDVTGEPAADLFAAAPPGAWCPLVIPIADVAREGLPVACASIAQWPGDVREGVRRKRRRPDAERLATPAGRGIIPTGGGAFKALDIPVPTRHAAWIDFHVRGDRARLSALLPLVTGLGRARGQALGQVEAWEILDDPADRSLVCEGAPMRPLPVASDEAAHAEFPGGFVLRECGTRAPYWHRASRAVCACPA